MIIVRLMGGLGNQMFQYALARHLALRSNQPLKLDLSWFSTVYDDKMQRSYGLNYFKIIEDFATKEEISYLIGSNETGTFLSHYWNGFLRYYKKSYIKERYFHFDSTVLNVSKSTYLEGYWQSEKYFKNIQDILRKEFTVKTELEGKNKEIAQRIIESESVCIHVRRGDYISNPEVNKLFGICSLDYYHNAIQSISNKKSLLSFFIFSDDIEWVKANFNFNIQMTIVDHNREKFYEDFRLMTLCKHHIISNSSFSWWSAWLSPNLSKLVCAPKKWFNDESKNVKDLIPESWIRI